MKKKNLFLIIIFYFLQLEYALADNLKILTTIKPIQSIASAVAGQKGNVELLLDKNSSPHNYSLKPSDAKKIQDAKLIFIINYDFEPFMVRAAKIKSKDSHIFELSKGSGVRLFPARHLNFWIYDPNERSHHDHSHHSYYDFHIWLDPENAKAIAQNIAVIFSEVDPKNKDYFYKNAELVKEKIDEMDKKIKLKLQNYLHVPYLVFHDGYQYFEKHYHLNSLGTITLDPNKQISIKKINQLKELIKNHNVNCIFSEPNASTSIIDVIKNGTKIKVGVLDAEWGIYPDDKVYSQLDPYLLLMNNLANNLTKCFKEAESIDKQQNNK